MRMVFCLQNVVRVLILVVMEEGQRPLRQKPLLPCTARVLILVVMEEGQRQAFKDEFEHPKEVLILVVMEEGQRLPAETAGTMVPAVLILVVMEEGQRPPCCIPSAQCVCLNPCCNGRGSKTHIHDS